jgi:hypothetical protein
MKQIGWILAVLLAVLAGPAWAQEAPVLENLEISLWPEFDRPDMLVIYRGFFETAASLPVPVDIRIPADSGTPTAVAFVDEAGDRFNQQYTTRLEDDALVISFELSTLGFQLEYYDELSIDPGGQRAYTYAYTADYPVKALSVEFQVPPTAEDYGVDPAADSVVPEADGLLYHVAGVGPVDQGETRSWVLTYSKADPDLTVAALTQSQPAEPAPVPMPVSGDSSAAVIFSIAFVALVGVGAGAFWLGRRTQSSSEEAVPASRRRPSGLGHRAALYCHKCGAQLRADSDFCHKCGAEVRE